MLRTSLSLVAFCALGITAAAAQCAANFRQEGVPLISGITYRTSAVVARKSGKGSRVDAVFAIQPGQVTSGDLVKEALCRIIESVG